MKPNMASKDGIPVNPTTSGLWEIYWRNFETADYINYTPQLLAAVRRHVDLQGANVLEVGSGTGGNASELARLGAKVTTIDFAPTALQRTLATGQQTGADLHVVQADARNLPFAAETYDIVYHQGFLEHFTDPGTLIVEQRRVLKRGGFLLVDVPQRYNWYTIHKRRLIRAGNWPYGGWECEFSAIELAGLLRKTRFTIVDKYSWGYFPRIWLYLRELEKLEPRLLKRRVLPMQVWQLYDKWFEAFERSWVGCNVLQCVGMLAQKTG